LFQTRRPILFEDHRSRNLFSQKWEGKQWKFRLSKNGSIRNENLHMDLPKSCLSNFFSVRKHVRIELEERFVRKRRKGEKWKVETFTCRLHDWLPARSYVNSSVREDAWEIAHVKIDTLIRRIGRKKMHECRNLAVILRFVRNNATLWFITSI